MNGGSCHSSLQNTLSVPQSTPNNTVATAVLRYMRPMYPSEQGRNRGIFLRGQSHFSWFFFPTWNAFSRKKIGRPKTNFRRFQKWKKKSSSPFFYNFSFFRFQFSTFPFTIYNFPSFLLNFLPFSLYSLPLFSRYVSKNFPVRSLLGAISPPLPPPIRHCIRGNWMCNLYKCWNV